ncbi:MAG: creatininase family protein, partial [Thermoanaerobaculia bacterium]
HEAMAVHRLAEMTWTEVRDLDLSRSVAILPVGAVEAHGPHLPLITDRIIAEAMAEVGAAALASGGLEALILPAIDYTAANFAAAFPGTVSVRPETVTALVTDIGEALSAHSLGCLAIANAHLDPIHLRALHDAVHRIRSRTELAVAFPDVTRKPWASRLTEEFRSGACHAGRYEGSIVLARQPRSVRDRVRRQLAANPASLSRAIREGLETFAEAGGSQAYFGDPASASAAEGESTIAILAGILRESVLAAFGKEPV